MKKNVLKNAMKHWDYVAPLVAYPNNKKEYNLLVARLDELLDIVSSDEKHSLMGLVDILSNLISTYEEKHCKTSRGNGINALIYLMAEHNLRRGHADSFRPGLQG